MTDIRFVARRNGTLPDEGIYGIQFPQPGANQEVTLRVVFDKTPDCTFDALSKLNLGEKWTGKAVSGPVKVILRGRL